MVVPGTPQATHSWDPGLGDASSWSHQPTKALALKGGMRVVKQWHRLPREVGDAASLQTFKVRLDGTLSNLI